jgi:hypothetical protein
MDDVATEDLDDVARMMERRGKMLAVERLASELEAHEEAKHESQEWVVAEALEVGQVLFSTLFWL